jgi:hypothetical protein
LSKENINIIVEILRKAISGNLFSIEYNGYTLFNKYIINIIPQIFDIVINLNKDCTLPEFINKLIQEKKFESYDYFKEKKEENIQYQSICFSYSDLLMFIKTIIDKKLENYCVTKTQIKSDFQRLRTYQKHFNERYDKGISENKVEFLFM